MESLMNLAEILIRTLLGIVLMPFGIYNMIRSIAEGKDLGIVSFALLAFLGFIFLWKSVEELITYFKEK